MNGRVQDAITGRFLSADPYITEPGNTQNYNRYSYVYNNPMSFTDPTGFCDEQNSPHIGQCTDDFTFVRGMVEGGSCDFVIETRCYHGDGNDVPYNAGYGWSVLATGPTTNELTPVGYWMFTTPQGPASFDPGFGDPGISTGPSDPGGPSGPSDPGETNILVGSSSPQSQNEMPDKCTRNTTWSKVANTLSDISDKSQYVAIASGGAALLTSETVVGGIGFGTVAAGAEWFSLVTKGAAAFSYLMDRNSYGVVSTLTSAVIGGATSKGILNNVGKSASNYVMANAYGVAAESGWGYVVCH